MKKCKQSLKLILAIILVTNCISTNAQKPFFIGIQPALTKETFYDKNEFDVNIIPLVFQRSVGKRVDVRLTTIANYHFGNGSGFSDIGAQCVAPVFIKKRDDLSAHSEGFYIGPLLGIGRNLMNDHNTITFGLEPGYMFPISKHFTISLGAQFGGSYFFYDNDENILRQHFGFKFNIGFWL